MNTTALLNFESASKGAQTQSDELNTFVATSLKVFIEESYKKMAPSFIIVLSCRQRSPLNFFLGILHLVFHLVYHMNVQLVYIDHKSPQRMEGPRKHNLLLVDSFEAFLDIDVISYTRNYQTNEFYNIFLMQQDRYIYQDMKSIFSYCWKNHIINCNVQYQNRMGEIYMHTYFPFSPNKCGDTEPQVINQFVGDSWVNKTFFHFKLRNFYKCSVVAAVRNVPPYAFVTKTKDGTVSFKGIEMDLLLFLADKMNFTADLRTISIDDRLTPIGRGGLKMISEHEADLAIGFYRKRPGKDEKYSCTFPHSQNSIVGVVYLPAHKLNTFEVLLFPFSYKIWCTLLLILFITFIFILWTRTNRPESISPFLFIACVLGSPITLNHKFPHSTMIFISWLWSSCLLRIIYAGLLFHVLRYQVYSSLPATLGQALNRNFDAVMNDFTYNDVKEISIYSFSQNRTSIVLDSKNDMAALYYIEKRGNKHMYAVISLDFLLHFMESNKNLGLFYTLRENIMQQQITIYLAKHSFLINHLDWEILGIRSVGLIKFWNQNYINTKYSVKKELYQEASFVQKDLWSIYAVCIVLYFIAFLILLIEMLSLKLKFLKRLFE